MYGYANKILHLVSESSVRITVQIAPTGTGQWRPIL